MLRYSICKGQSREVFGTYLGLHLADSISYVKLPAQRRRAATSGGAELSGAEGAAEGEKRTKNPRSNPVAGPRGMTRAMTDGAESANSTRLSELLENHFDQKRNHRRGALPWAFFPDRLSHDFDEADEKHGRFVVCCVCHPGGLQKSAASSLSGGKQTGVFRYHWRTGQRSITDHVSKKHADALEALTKAVDWVWITGNHDAESRRVSRCHLGVCSSSLLLFRSSAILLLSKRRAGLGGGRGSQP